MDLGAMLPHNDLASTGYCLAEPGAEYLVFAPGGGEISVDLSDAQGALRVRWFDPGQGTFHEAPQASGGERRTFRTSDKGDAVLHIRA
jgi:hypothetical protein